ncbi:MOSC N-terminal beta barrel domain-containing protein [Streptomyces sp. DSM 44917]|uniref:MOSC N-terminal beta barrel domain-containing protein n=1 Tax=Streptomyces boetiae TaxID=3075541 RepID=A0ABU2L3V9_9ACTN|nr:MOSC N-terminal beta barrel domain-containing protein [Streptomyces sp. DSM 44917]MDT0306210.1 MOSC N-terminal beta barrel domain-containing protein [Streptomyces sp. DSM 44917]
MTGSTPHEGGTAAAATITELYTYPVKGCAGTPLRTAAVTPAGLAHDRTFMVTAEDGAFRSQRRDPRLARVRPSVDGDGAVLTLRADGFGEVAVAVSAGPDAPRRPVTLFGTPYPGIDQGAEAAAWLSEVLGAPSRLVRVPPEHDRVTDGETAGTSGYADSAAVHLVSAASLDALNARIEEGGERPVPMDRFRPNIVVDGWPDGAGLPAAHAEDRVRRLAAGTALLGYAKPAIRCAVTRTDQVTGARSGLEPLRTLAAYRREPEGGVSFGVKFAVLRPGRLAVGDAARAIAWTEDGAPLPGR